MEMEDYVLEAIEAFIDAKIKRAAVHPVDEAPVEERLHVRREELRTALREAL